MKIYGLLGYPLGHSFSKKYFGTRLDYKNFEFERVEDFIRERPCDLGGFNVTIPHKSTIIPYLDSLSPQAQQIGAVNCVRVDSCGKLCGYNTDAYGFQETLLELIGSARPDALVLGSGGAAKAVCYVLKSLKINHKIVSRSTTLNYSNLTPDIIASHPLIINTTPLGMHPHIDGAPEIDYRSIGKNHYLYDLVYNPTQTKFLYRGRKQGARVINGKRMLELQAEKSYQIWTNPNPPE